MIKVKNRQYFISERLLEKPFKKNGKFFVKFKDTHEIQEVDEQTYYKLGGK